LRSKIKPNTAFIDTNVIVNWLIVSSALKTKGAISEKEKKKLLKNLKNKVKKSYDLLEKIRTGNEKKITFYISYTEWSEIFSGIGMEYRSRILKEKGVPLRYWTSMIYDIKLFDKDLDEILKEINSFYIEFIETHKIEETFDQAPLMDIGNLIWKYKCSTQDALILSQAITERCQYFISEDQRLRRQLKNNKDFKIKLYPSDRYLREIFK